MKKATYLLGVVFSILVFTTKVYADTCPKQQTSVCSHIKSKPQCIASYTYDQVTSNYKPCKWVTNGNTSCVSSDSSCKLPNTPD